ncbi:DNA-binding transcriptional MerR regulator [Streptomyces sp. V4I23]|uniref:MerR family transcriptional regulator n=1 Tax=Streptomyces sp. V4I23 TaxID=3042282 RepID=UPI0027898900|nr:MerR family transcriptional regulator [Streptomyces sp. V4I23]MDQ1011128.1 DNA-binding transcriptional MerR regulator [Streptomyces sp. V4I23]
MRIGEIAAFVGVTPRAVRHYHHLGLLPEPVRRANGYRDYTVRDAVLLARIRRLTELGLGLDEVRDVLADDAGRDLVEVLEELDADLGRQEALIHERRARLAVLLGQARDGSLTAEGPVSPRLAELFGDMARASARLPGPEPAIAAKDRELLALLDTVAPDAEQERLMGAMRRMTEAPGAMERAYAVYEQLDALVDADRADARVEEAARALAALLPDEVAEQLGGRAPEHAFMDAFLADFSPAQAAVVTRALRLVVERGR